MFIHSLKLLSLEVIHGVVISLIMLTSVVIFLGAMYLESGLTSATVLFTNLAFEEQVSLCFFVLLDVCSLV